MSRLNGRQIARVSTAKRKRAERGHGEMPAAGHRCSTDGVAVYSRAVPGVDQARAACSGERGFAVVEQQLMTDSGSEYVVDLLKPG